MGFKLQKEISPALLDTLIVCSILRDRFRMIHLCVINFIALVLRRCRTADGPFF
jgi:hypothetical protein